MLKQKTDIQEIPNSAIRRMKQGNTSISPLVGSAIPEYCVTLSRKHI